MFQTLILPGLNGSAEEHWQRIWAAERPGCKVVEQDNWTCPHLPTWKQRLEYELARTQSPVFILAHSLGCILAASMADSPLASKISGAMLVAPADMEVVEWLHPCTVQMPWFPEDMLPFESLIVGSLNDPYMTVPALYRHAQQWGSRTQLIGHAGHINIASGFGRWADGYDIFDAFRKDALRPRVITTRQSGRSVCHPLQGVWGFDVG
ncbi:RBBP9/YdeN family alpha/beta hydrolase [Allorhizobium undicola]|uniref:RBBP9/YdeN family alpha/beta hydrolase n=1 Tax=Allorhizobium undicola TaxID=78527 RepID=UPI000482191E|nr:alpha/beta hydrolase [Allorhizobium undicola]